MWRLNLECTQYMTDYVERVLKPQTAFTEELFEKNLIVEEKEVYEVPKFIMVTFKLLGDKILCEDKKKVSVLDAQSMQQIASINMPDENCYLTAVYKDQLTNTILMAYDNKKMIGVDGNNYMTKSVQHLKSQGMKFVDFHGDPQNFVLLACERGTIIVYKPQRNMIMGQFDMEEAIKQERIENGEELNEDDVDVKVGDLIDLVKTRDVSVSNEYMALAKEGLFFVKIKEIKRPGNGNSNFQFELNHEEKYFEEQAVKGVFEYDTKKLIVVVNNSKNIRFIDRIKCAEEAKLAIPNISKDSEYRGLQPFPNYDYQTFPYVMLKDSKCLNVINVRTKQSRVILKTSPYSWDVIRSYLMDFGQFNNQQDKAITFYNLELESKPIPNNARGRENNSRIKKLAIDIECLDSCFK